MSTLGDPAPCEVCGWLTTEYVDCCYASVCSADCNRIHQATEHLRHDIEPRLLPPKEAPA